MNYAKLKPWDYQYREEAPADTKAPKGTAGKGSVWPGRLLHWLLGFSRP